MLDPELKRAFSDLMKELVDDMTDENIFIVEIAKRAFDTIGKLPTQEEDGLLDALSVASEAVRKVDDYRDISNVEDAISPLTPEALNEMAAIAYEFDKSGEPMLVKQAAVLDEILLTIGAHKAAVTAAKNAQDAEIARIKAADTQKNDPYTMVKTEHDKQNKVTETRQMIADKVKEYRPMESSLSTRTCPDHPGAQMARIAEHTFQCSLDKGIYNYENGYSTMKGNKIPGGSVSNQTQTLHDQPNEFTSFDTRESKLNSSQ